MGEPDNVPLYKITIHHPPQPPPAPCDPLPTLDALDQLKFIVVPLKVRLPPTSKIIHHQPAAPAVAEPVKSESYCPQPHQEPHQACIKATFWSIKASNLFVAAIPHPPPPLTSPHVASPSSPGEPFIVAPHPPEAAAPHCQPFHAKLKVVHVRSQLPCTLMCKIQFVGVMVTVFAPGANVVYCLVMYVQFDPVMVNAPAPMAQSDPFPTGITVQPIRTRFIPSYCTLIIAPDLIDHVTGSRPSAVLILLAVRPLKASVQAPVLPTSVLKDTLIPVVYAVIAGVIVGAYESFPVAFVPAYNRYHSWITWDM